MIEMLHIVKAFGGKPVLDDVTLRIDAGEHICLMGPSGYGKTTLLHILLGLVEADSGRVEGTAGRRLAPVFQEDRLCEGLSAGANIRMTARDKIPEGAIDALLEAMGMPATAHTPVRELSGGMKRRVAIARALLSGGDIFVFDEPFQGLDDDTKADVIACVRSACEGKTLVWVTHDAREAEAMGGRVVHFPQDI